MRDPEQEALGAEFAEIVASGLREGRTLRKALAVVMDVCGLDPKTAAMNTLAVAAAGAKQLDIGEDAFVAMARVLYQGLLLDKDKPGDLPS